MASSWLQLGRLLPCPCNHIKSRISTSHFWLCQNKRKGIISKKGIYWLQTKLFLYNMKNWRNRFDWIFTYWWPIMNKTTGMQFGFMIRNKERKRTLTILTWWNDITDVSSLSVLILLSESLSLQRNDVNENSAVQKRSYAGCNNIEFTHL